jgi:hypothetical protein
MSNRIALILIALIAAYVAADLVFGWGSLLFLAKKLTDLIEWIAFWR